jgi:hypothetical protein
VIIVGIREKLIGTRNPGYNSVLRDKKTGQFVSKSRRKRAAARAKRLKNAADARSACGKNAGKTRTFAGAGKGVVQDLVSLRIMKDSLVDRIIAAGVAELIRRILSVDARPREEVNQWL